MRIKEKFATLKVVTISKINVLARDALHTRYGHKYTEATIELAAFCLDSSQYRIRDHGICL